MFGRRKRQLKNAATTEIEVPGHGTIRRNLGKTEITNQAPGYTGIAIVAAIFIITVPFIGWWILVGLFDAIGENRPEQAAGNLILLFIEVVASLGIIYLGAWVFSTIILRPVLDHFQALKQMDVQKAEARSRYVQQIPAETNHRMTSAETRTYRAVMMAMDQGYRMIDDTGKLIGNIQPWSRRSVGDFALYGEHDTIGENSILAGKVKRYLINHQILLDDRTVNLEEFPDLNAVEAQLVGVFGPLVNRGVTTNRGDRGDFREYTVIDNSR